MQPMSPNFSVTLSHALQALMVGAAIVFLLSRERLSFRKPAVDRWLIAILCAAPLPLAVLLLPPGDVLEGLRAGVRSHLHPIGASFSDLLRSDAVLASGLLVLSAGVLAPVFEEALFRGYLLRLLDGSNRLRNRPGRIAFIASVAFGAAHLPNGFFFQFHFSFPMIHLRRRYDSLLPGIAFHSIWNLSWLLMIARVAQG